MYTIEVEAHQSYTIRSYLLNIIANTTPYEYTKYSIHVNECICVW